LGPKVLNLLMQTTMSPFARRYALQSFLLSLHTRLYVASLITTRQL
jgi:hypothetical protein